MQYVRISNIDWMSENVAKDLVVRIFEKQVAVTALPASSIPDCEEHHDDNGSNEGDPQRR